MMADGPNGPLYLGVTSDLIRRVHEHREGVVPGFTRRYSLKRLVWYERFDDIEAAIQREKTMKQRKRAWKVAQVFRRNPGWDDLYGQLLG